jgi:hypothetical protein
MHSPTRGGGPVIILTSSIGSPYLLEQVTPGGEMKPEGRELVMAELRRHFRPEFLNRIDDIVLFKPLRQHEIELIVDLMFNDLRKRLADRRLTLEVTENARRMIARKGYGPVYGARPLRRFRWRPRTAPGPTFAGTCPRYLAERVETCPKGDGVPTTQLRGLVGADGRPEGLVVGNHAGPIGSNLARRGSAGVIAMMDGGFRCSR